MYKDYCYHYYCCCNFDNSNKKELKYKEGIDEKGLKYKFKSNPTKIKQQKELIKKVER